MDRRSMGENSASMAPRVPRRPPRDFFSPAVRLRLFLLVFMLWLVTMLVTRVGDERLWKRMWGEAPGVAGGPPLEKSEVTNTPIDTRIDFEAERDLGGKVPPRAPEAGAAFAGKETPSALAGASEADDLWSAAMRKGIAHATARLTAPEREELQWVVGAALENDRYELAASDSLREVTTKYGEEWETYLAGIRTALETNSDGLSAKELADWKEIAKRLDHWWSELHQRGLQAVLENRSISPEQRVSLAEFQRLFLERNLDAVRDGSVFQADDSPAWYQLLTQLKRVEQSELEKRSLGRVGFVHLFGQSKEFRGKLVTVRGIARRIYYQKAPSNLFGVEGYYIFWIRPSGGPDSPIIVYSLELPPGFELSKFDGRVQNHEFEFTGYAFKRLAYAAQDGARLAPSLLAKLPRWEPPAAAPVDPISFSIHAWVAVLSALGAILGVAGWAYINRQRDRTEREREQQALPPTISV